MKIRIKGNTVRLRLTKPEVETFNTTGFVEERTDFFPNPFVYAIKADGTATELKVIFQDGRLDMLVPADWVNDWTNSNRVGFESSMKTEKDSSIYLMLEKDFKCLDQTVEDQYDQYENPLKLKS